MDILKYQNQIKETVLDPMTEYMNECGEDCSYGKKDIAKCESLLASYITDISGIAEPNDKDIMKLVKKLVLALNKLNEKCDFELLETDAREAICEIIQNAAVECGLSADEDDITEEWREW